MEAPIFHADDWGLSPAVNAGILELARRGWLRSASCMATEKYLETGLAELLASGATIYLHFNLTYGRALADGSPFPSHPRWLWKSLWQKVDSKFVAREVNAQLDRLEAAGARVVGVNGHHHIHLLPSVAAVVTAAMARRSLRRVLVLDDFSHPWSWLQTRLCAPRAGVEIERAAYLRPWHLRSRARYFGKLRAARAGGRALLVHPAAFDDFESCGVTDSLREHRVKELEAILNYAY